MATIYRALGTGVLLLWAWVLTSGVQAGESEEALALHLRAGLVAALVGAAVQSLPFAYFLGTHFWVKAFARASRAGDEWEQRHRQWMKGRAYPAMYLAPLLTLAVAISGSAVETGRLPGWLHPTLVSLAIVSQLITVVAIPMTMKANAALMDELADAHQVPKPGTPAMEQLIEEEEKDALPPLFQLSRVLLLFSAQALLLWLYLRYGTESFRGAPLWPFAILSSSLLTLGLGLNARHDPDHPAPPARAWPKAVVAGVAAAAVLLLLVRPLFAGVAP